MKIEKNDGRGSDLYNKNNYVIHKKNLKQALNHELLLENVHRVIKLNQEVWLKPYISMANKKNFKMILTKIFFKLMNNAFFAKKTIENVKKHRDIKLVTKMLEGLIWYQNQTIIKQIFFFQKIY